VVVLAPTAFEIENIQVLYRCLMILAKYTQVKGIEGVFPVIVGPERAAQMTSNMEGQSTPHTLIFLPEESPG